MTRYCAHYSEDSSGLLLDCQADVLSNLSTRVVVPLLPPDQAPAPAARLNPRFEIRGAPYVMVTQFIAAVPASSLGKAAASLEEEAHVITNALDMLLTGV